MQIEESIDGTDFYLILLVSITENIFYQLQSRRCFTLELNKILKGEQNQLVQQ